MDKYYRGFAWLGGPVVPAGALFLLLGVEFFIVLCSKFNIGTCNLAYLAGSYKKQQRGAACGLAGFAAGHLIGAFLVGVTGGFN